MSEYHKITKKDLNFPNYCYFFISEIQESLINCDVNNPGDELEVEIEGEDCPYCHDGIELILKSFKRKGFKGKMASYRVNYNEPKTYTYKWILTKNDDLPF